MTFICHHCNKSFKDRVALNQHKESKHGKLTPKQQSEKDKK